MSDGMTRQATYEFDRGVNPSVTDLSRTPPFSQAVEIRPYTPDLEPLVKAFNLRLRHGGETYWAFPESHVPRLPMLGSNNPYQELFLALDRGAVRGGYLLTHSKFDVRGGTTWIACGPQLNMSEGIVDKSYVMVGALNVLDALKRQPLLYGLGMGGFEQPAARLLAALKWPLRAAPFFFKVVHPSAFFSNITYLRKKGSARFLLDMARYTGLGSVAMRAAQFRAGFENGHIRAELCDAFGGWADECWRNCKDRYCLLAVRDSDTLNRLYPWSDKRFFRVKFSHAEKLVGWAVLLDTQMSNHKQFGNMRVGSIVDCLAQPEDAVEVVRHSSSFLEQRGVDMIVSNQTSSAWGDALIACGFLQGPSNFILALSPLLASRLDPLTDHWDEMHLNRGDGDGPIHL